MNFDAEAIHVIWGDSAAGSFRPAFGLRRNQMVVCSDQPSIGRQNFTADLNAWADARWKALEEVYGNKYARSWQRELGSAPISNLSLLKSEKPLVFWSDDLLSTQLLIAFVCFLFTENGWDIERLHIIHYRYRPSTYWQYSSISMMSVKLLTENRPKTEKLSGKACSFYSKIWRDYCASDPAVHGQLISNSAVAELTHGALTYLKRRYPASNSGLDEIETGWSKQQSDTLQIRYARSDTQWALTRRQTSSEICIYSGVCWKCRHLDPPSRCFISMVTQKTCVLAVLQCCRLHTRLWLANEI